MLSQNPSPLTLLSSLLSPFLSRFPSPSGQSAEIVAVAEDDPRQKRRQLLKRFQTLNTRVDHRTFSSQHVALYTKNKIPHPQPTCTQYQLVTDSSKYAVGAALHQVINGNPVTIGFFSKKLTTTPTRYSTFDRELLAAYLSVLHFRHLIEGREVLLLTDHKPICGAFHSLKPAKSDRQQRQLAIIT